MFRLRAFSAPLNMTAHYGDDLEEEFGGVAAKLFFFFY